MGRMDNGETFAVIERRRIPFFYVRASDETPARDICERERPAADVIASDRRTMDGAPVLRLETATTSASQKLRDALHREGIRTYEADIKPSTQLLMDLRIHGPPPSRASGGRGAG